MIFSAKAVAAAWASAVSRCFVNLGAVCLTWKVQLLRRYATTAAPSLPWVKPRLPSVTATRSLKRQAITACPSSRTFQACGLVLQQPLSRARIEIAETLPMEGVAGIIIQMKISSGNVRCDFLAHPARGEDIILTADDEHRALDVLEIVERVMAHGGGGLSFHRVNRLRRWIGRGFGQPTLHVVPAVVVVEPRLREDEHLNIVHEILRTHGRLALHHVLPGVEAEAILTRPSAHEDGALHFVWMTQSKLLGDHGTKGTADNTGFLDAKLIHQSGIVIRHLRGGVGASGLVRETDSAIVTENAAEVLGPSLSVGIPNATRSGDAHDADERFARAALFVEHVDTVCLDVRHRS